MPSNKKRNRNSPLIRVFIAKCQHYFLASTRKNFSPETIGVATERSFASASITCCSFVGQLDRKNSGFRRTYPVCRKDRRRTHRKNIEHNKAGTYFGGSVNYRRNRDKRQQQAAGHGLCVRRFARVARQTGLVAVARAGPTSTWPGECAAKRGMAGTGTPTARPPRPSVAMATGRALGAGFASWYGRNPPPDFYGWFHFWAKSGTWPRSGGPNRT